MFWVIFFSLVLIAGLVKNSTLRPVCFSHLKEEDRVFAEKFLEKLKNDLKDKVPEDYLQKTFCRPELTFNPEVMIKSLTWKEAKLPYHQFFEEERIERARNFLKENKELLSAIENYFKVDKELITAIFLVETDLGRKTGKNVVLNTFFSLALTGEESLFKRYLKNFPELNLNNETLRARWQRRSNWAYRELLYFLEIAYKNQWDPYSIRGSVFGAFGYPQFVPRSYLLYGYDWDGDGKVDLFSLPDALASIANYLSKEGYRMESNREYKKKIVMKYNISEPYAETVLTLTEILKKGALSENNEQRGN